MKIYYDTEFLEDGKTIELISIGMVDDAGRELYLVNRDAPWKRIKKHTWLMENVVPKLPQPHGDWRNHAPKSWLIDFHSPHVRDRGTVADLVTRFVVGGPWSGIARPEVELWADYGAYDHVALCQLFGRMIDLPHGMPMWTNDMQQELRRLGYPKGGPTQGDGEHNALDDARHLKAKAEWLATLATDQQPPGGEAGA